MVQINVRNSQLVYTADIFLSTDQQRIFVKVTIHNNKYENMHGCTVGINETIGLKYFVRNNLENQIRKKKKLEKIYQQVVKSAWYKNFVSAWYYLIRKHKILLFSKILKSRLDMLVQKKTIFVISFTHIKHDYLPWGKNVHCKSFQKNAWI